MGKVLCSFFFYYVFREDLKKVSPNKQKVAACAKAPSNNKNKNSPTTQMETQKKRLRWERRNKNRLMKSVYLKKGFPIVHTRNVPLCNSKNNKPCACVFVVIVNFRTLDRCTARKSRRFMIDLYLCKFM